ncbi:MAG TPA: alpha/beta hydrolase-fold protein [Vicinamibacterales bacterium]|nr:alpha/beta hydrolase-fold protein [Vicinamibacterales bacterium]
MHPPESQLRRHEQFHSQYLEHDRDVLVWTPPGYAEQPARRYPVLYMHDGQNLFEPDTAFQKGEYWRVGETAAALIEARRIEPIIVVGVYNTGDARIDEYTPTGDHKLGGGHADDYGRMLIEELKPLIDAEYRTLPERDHTGLAGSSLGGLVSLHLGFTHPSVFSKVAALSPSVWWDRKAILRTVRQARSKPRLRLWVDMGTAEGRRGLDDARSLKAALVGLGFVDGVDLHYAEYEGATHSEHAWSERVGPVLEWLFPRTG